MEEIIVNYWAVLVGGVAAFVVGGIWYSPMLFGKLWMNLSGMTSKELETAKKKGMAKSYALGFVATLVMGSVLAWLMSALGMNTYSGAVTVSLWAWIGFVGPVTLNAVLWGKDKFGLWLLNNAQYLVSMIIIGLVVAAFA